MYKQISFNNDKATLYLVATPIGNLQEMTPRAIETLKNVDIIACEDTRTSSHLLNYFNIKKPLIAHHKFNEKESTNGIIDLLKQGKNIALISDAGYPLYSDPGSLLVKEVIKHEFNVVPISGANASINALVASGLAIQPYLFYGFLPATNSKRINELIELSSYPFTLIFYEAPHRLRKCLVDMLEVLGNRKIVIAKELTKKYETFIHTDLKEAVENIDEIKGEIVLVVEGYKEEENKVSEQTILDEFEKLIKEMTSKDAIKQLCKKYQLKKNEVYNLVHQKR